jgi:hypothetical protein
MSATAPTRTKAIATAPVLATRIPVAAAEPVPGGTVCPAAPSLPDTPPLPGAYAKIDGTPAIADIVALYRRRLLAAPGMARYFTGVDAAAIDRAEADLTAALTFILGGPAVYDLPALGPRLAHFRITPGDYEVAVRILGGCVWELGVPIRICLRLTRLLRSWQPVIAPDPGPGG